LTKLGYICAWLAFFILVVFLADLYMLKHRLQVAFDRSSVIAADQGEFLQTPDMPIDPNIAADKFVEILSANLNLNSSLVAQSANQRVRSVDIQEFEVINEFSTTSVSITNPLNGQVVVGEINRPSVVVLGIVHVHVAFLPGQIQIPVFSSSSGIRPL